MDYVHKSVLLNEVVENLVKNENGTYWDVTCGGGGHSYALLEKYPNIKIIASDWDINAIKATSEKLAKFEGRFTVVYGNMGNIEPLAKKLKIKEIDGFLADFGTSKNQILHSDGFSFKNDTYLDMRMSKGMHKKKAADIVNYASEKELALIFYEYGGENNSKRIARKIVEERAIKKLKTTKELATLIEKVVNFNGKIHPATKVFQALRIVVNNELNEIKSFLFHFNNYLKKEGRVLCISFHSLEDVLVKTFVKENKETFIDISKGIVIPTKEEIKENPSSRSAKLRIFEKK